MYEKTQVPNANEQVKTNAIQKHSKNKQFQSPYKTREGKLGPIQSKQGKKPPIQAKQRPVNKSNPTPRSIDPFEVKSNIALAEYQSKMAETYGVGNTEGSPIQRQTKPQSNDLKSLMGIQYGVDLSRYKEHQNSSFPASVGAAATIQGRNIHYAPGQYTTQNRKHELGHAIDNTLNGTPKGDATIQGHNIDTTREKAANKIADTPLQRKENTNLNTGKEAFSQSDNAVIMHNTAGGNNVCQMTSDVTPDEFIKNNPREGDESTSAYLKRTTNAFKKENPQYDRKDVKALRKEAWNEPIWHITAFAKEDLSGKQRKTKAFKEHIGQEAYDYLTGIKIEDLTLWVDFFRAQDYPLKNVQKQYKYLNKYKAIPEEKDFAERVLANCGYDPDKVESKIQAIKSVGGHEDVSDEIDRLVKEKTDTIRTNFKNKYKDITDSEKPGKLTRADGERAKSYYNDNGKTEAYKTLMGEGAPQNSRGQLRNDLNKHANDKLTAIAQQGKADLQAMYGALAPLYARDISNSNSLWCLNKSSADVEKLQKLVEWVDQGLAQGVAIDTIKSVVDGATLDTLEEIHSINNDPKPIIIELTNLLGTGNTDQLDEILTSVKGVGLQILKDDLIPLGHIPSLIKLLEGTGGSVNQVHNLLVTQAMDLGQIDALYADAKSQDSVVKLLTLFPDTQRVLDLINQAPNADTFKKFLKEIKGDANAVAAVNTELQQPGMNWDSILAQEDVQQARGLRTSAGTLIPEVSVAALPNGEDDREQDGVNNTLDHILGGPQPDLTHPDGAKFGNMWENREGRLPGIRDMGGYRVYYVEKEPLAGTYHGNRRLLKNTATGFIYYTDNHYAAGSFSRIH